MCLLAKNRKKSFCCEVMGVLMKIDKFMYVTEVAECLSISVSKAYKIIRILNTELNEKGYLTVSGRVSRKYFESRFGVGDQE